VVHNAAGVNYVANYEALKPHNIDGTRTMLRFAHSERRKQFHYISTTFIFGWTARGLLLETDNNDEMSSLDFGYAQTKWVAEQLVLAAQKRGLDARIYRPSLISASTEGAGDRNDVAIRLLAFMINHGIAVDTTNQVSILAADVAADNIAAIVAQRDVPARTFHVTVDGYYNMADLTRLLTREHGYLFTYYDIPGFIDEMNRRCTKADPLYPLLDFFNRSASKIAAMQLKRYRNDRYHEAKQRSASGRADPTLADTASYLVAFLREQGLIREPSPSPQRVSAAG
jgi:thioester reductase-like protein